MPKFVAHIAMLAIEVPKIATTYAPQHFDT